MKQVSINFNQRVGLVNFLAGATGPLGKIAALGRINDAVRFTDTEMQQIKITDVGNGNSAFVPPTPDFGQMVARIEDADAALLVQELDACQNFRIFDRDWVGHVRSKLTAPDVTSKRGK